MRVLDTAIPDIKIIEPTVYRDSRGYFSEVYNAEEFENAIGERFDSIQINESQSTKGTIRGLHLQKAPYSQAKLVRVVLGEVFDVVVDCRSNSETYGRHVAVNLSAHEKKQLWVPRGFAHGFQVLSDTCILSYQVDNKYAPKAELTLDVFDADLKIKWPLKADAKLSLKDSLGSNFKSLCQTKREPKNNFFM